MPPPLYPIATAKVSQRRSFMMGSASLALAVFAKERVFSAVKNMPIFSNYPFSLGVASGDPTPNGVALWTRLAPQPLQGGGMEPVPVEVSWQVAEDEGMSKIVRRGKTIATPEWGHSNWANNLIADFDDLDSKVVATEFVGTSISSGGDGTLKPKTLEATYAENPFVKFHSTERGYVSCEITPKHWKSNYQGIEYVSRPGAPLITRASFAVEAGKAGLQKA